MKRDLLISNLIINKYTLFWMIGDSVILIFSFFLALYLRFDMKFSIIPLRYLIAYKDFMIPISVITVLIYSFYDMYRVVWEYVSYRDLLKITQACFLSILVHIIGISIFFGRMPISYFFVGSLCQYVFTLILRFSRRIFLKNKINDTSGNLEESRVMIVGAGSAGKVIHDDILQSNQAGESNLKVVCYIDDDKNKLGRFINSTPILGGRDEIKRIAIDKNIDQILVAMPSAKPIDRINILNICNQTHCQVQVLPGLYQLVSGRISVSNMKKIQIEDLLGREPINLFDNESYEYVADKIIFVTGAGGSIGSELCRQLAQYGPKLLLIFDIYENNAYEIEQELKRKYVDLNFKTLIGSVRDYNRMKQIFETYHPDLVFHAAAHKHVPLMEESPMEAVKNNVKGTYILGLLSLIYGVQRFILISTDKAVNPTSVMGASKRACEKIIQSLNQVRLGEEYEILPKICVLNGERIETVQPNKLLKDIKSVETEFVAVRFGNVLGSNGSVIPLFKKQIEEGGPVTVTHPEVTRFFMTIPEAVKLVLQAGSIAKGGEIFVLDMGEPVKILDLAQELIRLSGLEPNIDIDIIFTGLRPGEKLYEEKLMDEEFLQKTRHDAILIGRPLLFDRREFYRNLESIINADDMEHLDVRTSINSLVSTYITGSKE